MEQSKIIDTLETYQHPKVIFKDNQATKLGDAPEGIPSFF